jgi:hypothetical protein
VINGLNNEAWLDSFSLNFYKTLSYLDLIYENATPWIMWVINLTPSSKVAISIDD